MTEKKEEQNVIRMILPDLGFVVHHTGYRLLCTAVPEYARNPGVSMTKELYPTLKRICPCNAEAAIRRSIRYAWEHGRREAWKTYFPNCTACPSNLTFIAAMSEYVR